MNKNTKFSFIDLFSGIGGFRMALSNIGGSCLNFSEINKDAIQTYCANFDESIKYNLGDIITKTIKFDMTKYEDLIIKLKLELM